MNVLSIANRHLMEGRHEEASATYAGLPQNSPVMLNTALCKVVQEKYEEAEAILRSLIDKDPTYVRAIVLLANCKRHAHDHDASIDLLKHAISVNGEWPQTHFLLSAAMLRRLEMKEAMAYMAKGLVRAARQDAIDTDSYAQCYYDSCLDQTFICRKGAATLLDCLYLDVDDMPGDALLSLHEAHDVAVSGLARCERRLSKPAPIKRVMFVSEQFRYCAMTGFMMPVISELAKHLEVICYHLGSTTDEITRVFSDMDNVVLRTVGNETVQSLRRQMIDDDAEVCVCLDGYTGSGMALNAMTPRVSPIQIDYLGYPHTTGRSDMDYKVVDTFTDPVDTRERYTEKPLRLQRSFLCWCPMLPDGTTMPTVHHLYKPHPVERRVIAPHNFKKLSKTTVNLFTAVLRKVPNVVLHLKSSLHVMSGRGDIVEAITARFDEDVRDRVEVIPYIDDARAHYEELAKYDVCLDTSPYNGTTTTAESLFCGVPVVTLCGDTHRARVSTSVLKHANLDVFVTRELDEYVKLAERLLLEPVGVLTVVHEMVSDCFRTSPVCVRDDVYPALRQAFADLLVCR